MESSPPSPSPSLRQPTTSIEDLPSGAIEDILNRMPLRDAVRTSVLSPDWRHRWKSIPDLDFGDDSNLPVSAINTVLNHHSSSPIRSFTLVNRHMTVLDVDRWLLSLSHPGSLSSLTLGFTLRFGFRPRSPLSSLFSFRSLMGLTNCNMPKSIPNGFENLASLHTHIDFARAEQIMLLLCLMRSAPNLKKIRFMGICRGQHISLDKDFWKQHPMGQLGHLQTVQFQISSNLVEPMVDFLLGVLEKANQLKKLLIISNCLHPSSSDDSTIQMLRNYQRASLQAEIIYWPGKN